MLILQNQEMVNISWILTVFCIYFSTVCSIRAAARDSLSLYESMKDDQTLVSSNQRYEFGFFSPGSAKNMSYVGIWYKSIRPVTVVWVANRKNPLKNSAGRLILSSNGGLAIQDSENGLFWISPPNRTVYKPFLKLLDSGNLVLRDSSNLSKNGYFWQSFDYPTDTLLPGMKLGMDYNMGLDRALISWNGIEDPSPGLFRFSMNSSQLLLQRNEVIESRWGPWDGQKFSGTDAFSANPIFTASFLSSADELSFTLQLSDPSVLLRLLLTPWGVLILFKWNYQTSGWISMETIPKDNCDQYAACGPNGICNVDDPNCRCPKGFKPKSPEDWTNMDYSGGCKRVNDIECKNDGFLRHQGLKLPDNSLVWANLSRNQCRKKCLENCACMAYANINTYGNASQCLLWLGDLLDLRIFHHGENKIYIRMAHKELGRYLHEDYMSFTESLASTLRRDIGMSISLCLVLLFWAAFLTKMICSFGIPLENKTPIQSDVENVTEIESLGEFHVEPMTYTEDDVNFYCYDLETLCVATNNFSEDNRLGQGGYGVVYEGKLPSEKHIAVKKLKDGSWQGLPQFKNEAKLIARLQHRNLIKLLGYCIQGGEKMLVYEYLSNKSLDKIIFDQSKKNLLPWEKRFEILKGIAKGLAYLHHDSRLRVIHRDLKASNVLLDSEMSPKISDFGLATIFWDDKVETTKQVMGTKGYMSPEYVMRGQFSTKSDVYSFGVLILEMICGKRNWGFKHPSHDMNLVGHAWHLWSEHKKLELMDPILESSHVEAEVEKCMHVGLLCVQADAEDRPTMCSVVYTLHTKGIVLPQPKDPGVLASNLENSFGLGLAMADCSHTTNDTCKMNYHEETNNA